MYKTFMTHAARLIKTLSDVNLEQRPFLQGVKHYENGDAAVTNTHVLYYAKGIHEKGSDLISPKRLKVTGKYPEVNRLFPTNDPADSFEVDTKLMLRVLELMELAQKASEGNPSMAYKNNKLEIESRPTFKDEPVLISAKYDLPEGYTISNEFYSDSAYWVLALKMFRAFKYDSVIFNLYHPLKPFTLVSPDGKLTALIMPIRNYR